MYGCAQQLLAGLLGYNIKKHWNFGLRKRMINFLRGEVLSEPSKMNIPVCFYLGAYGFFQAVLVLGGVVDLTDIVSDGYSVIYMEQFRKQCG